MRNLALLALAALVAAGAANMCQAREIKLMSSPPSSSPGLAFKDTLSPAKVSPSPAIEPHARPTPAHHIEPIHPDPPGKYEVLALSAMLQQLPVDPAAAGNQRAAAFAFMRAHLGIKDGEYVVKSEYVTDSTGVMHIYCQQVIQGIEISNGYVDVHVDSTGRITAYNDCFYRGQDVSKRTMWSGPFSHRFVKPSVAFGTLAAHIKLPADIGKIAEVAQKESQGHGTPYLLQGVTGAQKDVKVQQSYIQTKGGSLKATWEFFVRTRGNHFHAHVTADGNRLVALGDLVARASYTAFQLGDSPLNARRVQLVDPENKHASPYGWHNIGDGKRYTSTFGNNVAAYAKTGGEANSPKQYARNYHLNFDFPLEIAGDPSSYQYAAITNSFVGANMLHDLTYIYGFNEVAGNFQYNNWGKGGKGNDAMQVVVHDPDEDEPYFDPYPDGERSYLILPIYGKGGLRRDSNLDSSVITHEYSHGVSSRLTGGPHRVDCFSKTIQAGGVSEGTSDFFAYLVSMRKEDKPTTWKHMGEYAKGSPMRLYPYTTENTLKFSHINQWQSSIHKTGNVWGSILFDLYWELVRELGFTEDLYTRQLTKGNTLALQIVINSLKETPCHPTFLSARSALFEAEQELTGGKHICKLWTAFAKRGLGTMARMEGSRAVDDFTLPQACIAAAAATATTTESTANPSRKWGLFQKMRFW